MEGGKNFKIGASIAAFVLTLALSLAGFHFYNRYGVNEPMVQALEKVPGLEKVTVDTGQKPVLISITLDRPQDFKKTYVELDTIAKEKLGDKPYVIKIVDNPSSQLSALYDGMELAVYQGIANNSFLWLEDRVKERTQKVGAEYRLQVDENNLYLEVGQNNHHLYRVFKRNQESTTTEARG